MSTQPNPAASVVVVEEAPDSILGARFENQLADLCDFGGGGQNGGNPFEPTISTPWTAIASADYNPLTLNRTALTYIFKTFGIVRRFIRTPVDDAFRGGITITIPEISDPAELAKLHAKMKDEGDLAVIKDVATWGRLFGGSGLIPVTDDDPSAEFNPEEITEGSNLAFLAADRWELTMSGFNNAGEEFDKLANRQYGYSYPGRFNYYGIPMDASRVIKFLGQSAPSLLRQRLQGWALSELEQCMRTLNTYIKFQNLLFDVVDEAKVDVYKIQNFNSALASAQGSAAIKLRIALGNWLKNYQNALVMDQKDDYEQKQLAFSGLADINEEFRIAICCDLNMPMNKLFGQSASGFASGEDALENYASMIDAEVRDKIHKIVKTVIGLRCRQLWGYEPEFTYEFQPLRVLNGTEEEAVKTSKQNRALALYDRDLVDGAEVSEILKKDSLLTIETAVESGKRTPISPLEMQQDAQDQAAKADGDKAKADAKKENAKGIERLRASLRSDERRAA